MAEHLDRRLEAGEPDPDSDSVYLWTEGQDIYFGLVSAEEVPDECRDANARRLVAAWNACRGIPTERLERMRPGDIARLVDTMPED